MSRPRALALFAAVAIASAAGGSAFYLWSRSGAETRAAAQQILTARLTDLKGEQQGLERWRGHVLVVNFWATWCAPCREEIPGFVNLQSRYGARGLQFLGIAIDQPAPVAEFAREFRINYPLFAGGPESLELLRQAGNRAGVLPYTVIIDRDGNLVAREPGGLKEARLEAILRPLF